MALMPKAIHGLPRTLQRIKNRCHPERRHLNSALVHASFHSHFVGRAE